VKEEVKKFLYALEEFVENIKGICEHKKELSKLVDSFKPPHIKLPGNLSRRYVLYKDDQGTAMIVIEGDALKITIDTETRAGDELLDEVGLPKDFYSWWLANIIFFVKHAGEMADAIKSIAEKLPEEERRIRKFLEDLKELLAIIEMWKLSREGGR